MYMISITNYFFVSGFTFKLPFLLWKKKTNKLSELLNLFPPCWPLCKHMAFMSGLGEKDVLCYDGCLLYGQSWRHKWESFQKTDRLIFKTCKIFFCKNDGDDSSVVNPETLIFSKQVFWFKTFVYRKHYLQLLIDRPRLSLFFLSSCIKVLELYWIYFYIFNSARDFFSVLGQT